MNASQCTDEFLDELSQQGDPEADAVAAAYLGEGPPQSFLHHVAASHRLPPEQQHPTVAGFLSAPAPPPPPWVNEELLAAGSRFFDQWGVERGLGLLCFSLPSGYAAAAAAH